MTTRTPFWQSVSSLRLLEATIIDAGVDGITIADLQFRTGLSRRTIDRNLNALQQLGSGIYNDGSAGRVARRWALRADQAVFRQGGAVMSEQREWFHGVVESEFWTVYRGWRVFVRKGLLGPYWHWSILGKGVSVGSVENDRPAAEASAFAAVDRREVPL